MNIKEEQNIVDANVSDNTPETGLTPLLKERVNAIHHIYEESSTRIVKEVSGKGLRSWKTFFINALRVYKARGTESDYFQH